MYNLVIATKLSARRIYTKVNMIPKRNFKMSSIYMYIYYLRFTLQFTVVWWIVQFSFPSCQTTMRSDSIWPVLSRMDCSNTSILHSLQACVSCYCPNVDKNHALAAVEGRKGVGWAWNNIHMHVNIPNLISTRISVIAITVSWFSSLDFWWISDGPFSQTMIYLFWQPMKNGLGIYDHLSFVLRKCKFNLFATFSLETLLW